MAHVPHVPHVTKVKRTRRFPTDALLILPCAHNLCQICEQRIRQQMSICLSTGSGGRINCTAMIGGALLHGGIMNGTLVHGRMEDEG